MERVTSLDGVHNFRHWHGYAGLDGARVKTGLFRSGHFGRASEADRDYLHDLGVRTVVDFRRPSERQREPSQFRDATVMNVLTSDQDDHGEPPHIAFFRKHGLSGEKVREYMLTAYRRIPMEAGNQSVFREGLRAMASGDADAGLLAHCAAGKDRTGIFCAIVLGHLGVKEDEVFEDYLLTNHAVDFDVLVPRVRGWMQEQYDVDMRDEDMKAFLGVEADYLREAFSVMGDLQDYMTGALGLEQAELDALRDRWLAA